MLTLLRPNDAPLPRYPGLPFWENPEDRPSRQIMQLVEASGHPWGFAWVQTCRFLAMARLGGWKPRGTAPAPDWTDKVVREFYGELRKLGPGRLAEDTAGVREVDVIRWTGCYTTMNGGFLEPEDGNACAAGLRRFADAWRRGAHLEMEATVDRRLWWWELSNDRGRKTWDITGEAVVRGDPEVVNAEWAEFFADVLCRGRLQIDWYGGPRWVIVRKRNGEEVRAPSTRDTWKEITDHKMQFVHFAANG